MYAIYGNISGIFMGNVTIYGIHGSYGCPIVFPFMPMVFLQLNSTCDPQQVSVVMLGLTETAQYAGSTSGSKARGAPDFDRFFVPGATGSGVGKCPNSWGKSWKNYGISMGNSYGKMGLMSQLLAICDSHHHNSHICWR